MGLFFLFVFSPPVSRVVFLEGCGSNHSTMYRAFFCIKKKSTLSINVIILCTDLGSWPCFTEGMTHTLGPMNGDQRQIPAPVCVLQGVGGFLGIIWQRGGSVVV